MTIKKDLADIGKLLITPFPAKEKYRFAGVNYKRAQTQLTVGAVVLQFALVAGVLFGPKIADVVIDVKDNIKKKFKK